METALDRVCTSCGNPSLPYDQHCLFCGDVLSEYIARAGVLTDSTEQSFRPTTADGPAEYAGFWLRVWAGAIDASFECVVALLLSLAIDLIFRRFGGAHGISAVRSAFFTGMAFIGLLTVGAWLYAACMESSEWRATLGKRIVGLQVVNSEGGRLSFGQATVRHLMKFLSLFTAGIGFMMAGWTTRRQALHDIPPDSVVIRVPPRRFTSLFSN
jgi:uncharacterized RDD family membrane protein YckC